MKDVDMKPEVLATGPFPATPMDELERNFTVHKLWEAPDPDMLVKSLADIEAMTTSSFCGADRRLIEALPNLKIIANFGVGYDSVDVAAAKERGIVITNTPDVLTDDVADMAIALLLASTRRVVEGDRYVREGKWLEAALPLGRSLGSKLCGILGLGRIGLAIAQRLQAFNAHVVYSGPREKPDVPYRFYPSLVEMARDCDFLILSCPGGAATRRLVNAEVLRALGPKGTLVNVARGSVVDEEALVAALQAGELGHASLDVFEDEPRVPEALFAMDNVVVQPHQASATIETRAAMARLVLENLQAFFAGRRLLTPVT